VAAGDTYPARRIPVPESGDINEIHGEMRPGDYCGPYKGYTGDREAVSFMLPEPNGLPENGLGAVSGFRHVTSPPHVFTEQSDGSLEIRESILSLEKRPDGTPWHGYLDAGNVWREV
jgi:hypothetical protein